MPPVPSKLRAAVRAASNDGRYWGAWPNGDRPAAALSGDAFCVAAASAALTTAIQAAGAATVTVTASGALTDAGVLPLYTLGTPGAGEIGGPMTYEGSLIPAPWGTYGSGGMQVYQARNQIAKSNTAGRMWITPYQEDAIGEVILPTTWSMSLDQEDLAVGTFAQNFRTMTPVTTAFDPYPRICALTDVGGQVIVGAVHWYDTGPSPLNYMRVANGAALSSSTLYGMFQVTGGRHNAGWLADVPVAFQSALGCTHLQGFGGGISIQGMTVAGVSMYGVNAADILAATTTGQSVTATALADCPLDGANGMDGDMRAPCISSCPEPGRLWALARTGSALRKTPAL
jgi:hypothetical protein